MLPNFFLAQKSTGGTLAIAERQARYDGAFGARATHALHSLIEGRHAYDNQAYTITAILLHSFLRIYSSHIVQSRNPTRAYECSLTHISSFDFEEDDLTVCRKALRAYRNLQDWAKLQRDTFVNAMNDKYRERNYDIPSSFINELSSGFVSRHCATLGPHATSEPQAVPEAQAIQEPQAPQASQPTKSRPNKRKRADCDGPEPDADLQRALGPYSLRSRKRKLA